MGIGLQIEKHEILRLRDLPHFSEAWLHEHICSEPTMLGLGDVVVLDRERIHDKAGRLDVLLYDEENDRRYEVELMLGATDPSHIIRCIEYWDIERRHYPAYDHVAVLIAENITSRFLNVISLLAGSIPIIAIQINALRVGDKVILHFTQVVDQTSLRRDDEAEAQPVGGVVTRAYWEERVGAKMLLICDRVVELINEKAKQPQQLVFRKAHIGLSAGGGAKNFMYFYPKKSFVHVSAYVSDAEQWTARLNDAKLTAKVTRAGRAVRVTTFPNEVAQTEHLFRELVHCAVREYEE